MEKEAVIRRGKRAEKLLGDPTLMEALESLKQDQVAQFMSSSPENEHQRTEAYYMHKAVEKLELKLSSFKSDGIFEERALSKRS